MRNKLKLLICCIVVADLSYADPMLVVLDRKNRVQYVHNGISQHIFEYDEANNISREIENEKIVCYEYSDYAQLIKYNDSILKYDEFGRLEQKGFTSITYNEYNMMETFGDTN